MSRYSWDFENRDAYDEGHCGSFGSNPYDRYGPHEEEQKHRAWDEGYDDQRRERERREEERAQEYAEMERARRESEQRTYDEAMWEQQQQEEQPPSEPEFPEEGT